MLFPKHKPAAAWLSVLLRDGLIEKRYLALVNGCPGKDTWVIEAPIGKIAPARYGIVSGGKSAVTEFRLESSSAGNSLIEARPLTGRTHQIRVHLSSCGLPIIGDPTYGNVPAKRMMLHCFEMKFRENNGKIIQVNAPLDGIFEKLVNENIPAS
jgi:23S rRNA-/tRNA-specific pseudouridylate synthase